MPNSRIQIIINGVNSSKIMYLVTVSILIAAGIAELFGMNMSGGLYVVAILIGTSVYHTSASIFLAIRQNVNFESASQVVTNNANIANAKEDLQKAQQKQKDKETRDIRKLHSDIDRHIIGKSEKDIRNREWNEITSDSTKRAVTSTGRDIGFVFTIMKAMFVTTILTPLFSIIYLVAFYKAKKVKS